MANKVKKPRNRPWRARRRRQTVEYILGYFHTREEAEEAERGFDNVWPNERGKNQYA